MTKLYVTNYKRRFIIDDEIAFIDGQSYVLSLYSLVGVTITIAVHVHGRARKQISPHSGRRAHLSAQSQAGAAPPVLVRPSAHMYCTLHARSARSPECLAVFSAQICLR